MTVAKIPDESSRALCVSYMGLNSRMNLSVRNFLAGAALLGLLALAGCGRTGTDSSAPTGSLAAKLDGHLVVLDKSGTFKPYDGSLKGIQYVAFYHSAGWCAPCKIFTPKLVKFYDDFKPSHPNFELVFVSHDAGLTDMLTDVPIFDPALDSKRTMGQPCLAHLSFKLRADKGVMLTALYRNHYYVQRALGNLIGLSQLLYFVARESGLTAKSLVCHSTFARLDTDKGWSLTAVKELLSELNALASVPAVEEVA